MREKSPVENAMSPNTSGRGVYNSEKEAYFGGLNQKPTRQSYKEKLGKYLGKNSPTKNTTLHSLKNMDSTRNDSRLGTKQKTNDSLNKHSERKMKIEIKSREDIQSNENLEARLGIVKKLSPNYHINSPTSPREQTRDEFKSPPPHERQKADKEDILTKFGMSPRGYTPERKLREESTRLSKPPNFTIRWSSSSWPKADQLIRVDRILGQGSFAKVYQGFDLVSKSIVAIKILDKQKLSEMGFQKMAEKELEILQSASHPNICKFEKMIEDHKRVA